MKYSIPAWSVAYDSASRPFCLMNGDSNSHFAFWSKLLAASAVMILPLDTGLRIVADVLQPAATPREKRMAHRPDSCPIIAPANRSEERRVGKECGSRWT